MNQAPRAEYRQATPADARHFGRHAALYDRVRPGYQECVIEDIMRYAGLSAGMRVVEVGAGTGQMTLALARNNLDVHCIEPDARMAEILQHKTRHLSNVHISCTTFESSGLAPAAYDAVVAAQSWHWVAAEVRLRLAWKALRPSGALALGWHEFPCLAGPLAESFLRAHQIHAPHIHGHGAATDSMNQPEPFAQPPGLFTGISIRQYRNVLTYSTADFLGLLDTYPDYHQLPAEHRSELYLDLQEAIVSAGGAADIVFGSILHLARPQSAATDD